MNYFDAKQEVQISQKKIKQLKQTQKYRNFTPNIGILEGEWIHSGSNSVLFIFASPLN